MKKTLIILAGLLAVVASSCKKDKDPFDGREATITAFSFKASKNPVLEEDCIGTINGTFISVNVPFGTACDSLVATFTTSDNESVVFVADSVQTSDVTVNDFTVPVDYLVKLGEKKNCQYTVTVTYKSIGVWSPSRIDMRACCLALEICKDKPCIAAVQYVDGANGPVFLIDENDNKVQVSPKDSDNKDIVYQYLGFGISPSGHKVIYSQNKSAKKGNLFLESSGSWKQLDVEIEQTNAYYGRYIGFPTDSYFAMMTSNNAAGSVPKRNINVSSYDNGTVTTGQPIPGRDTGFNSYNPVLCSHNGSIYAFITNVSKGLSIYKLDAKGDKTWKEVITFSSTDAAFAPYVFGTYPQDMAISSKGEIYLALGCDKSAGYGVCIAKINPEGKTVEEQCSLVGNKINLTNSVSSRYSRIAIGKNDKIFFCYRNDDEKLCVTTLNEQKQWNEPAVLSTGKCDDVNIRADQNGNVYIACTVDEHIECFTAVEN